MTQQTDCNESRAYINFWGTRGSIPTAGLQYQKYGGYTSCLEVRSHEEIIIIDAGTGIQNLGRSLLQSKLRHIHLMIGHAHWDHIIGFPFFAPAYHADFTINIYAAPRGGGKSMQELFYEMLTNYFPSKHLQQMQARIHFIELCGPPVQLKDISVHYTTACHPGVTLCFKIVQNNKHIGYATDNELFPGNHIHPNEIKDLHILLKSSYGILDFYSSCDILIHEAQYTTEEYQSRVHWGHTSIYNAALLAQHCKPKQWIFTHHDAAHNDEALENKLQRHNQILRQCDVLCSAAAAYDGLKIFI